MGSTPPFLTRLTSSVASLHDGEVGCEVGIEHFVKVHAAQGGDHLAGDGGAHGDAEFLAQGGAYRGSRLHHHILVGIRQGGEHLLGIVFLGEGGGGAYGDALTAVDAGGIGQAFAPGAFDAGFEAAIHGADDAYVLHLGTHGHAAAAQHALQVVANDRGRDLVDLVGGNIALVAVLVFHAVLYAQSLQLTVGGAHAAQALLVVVGQDQLQVDLAGLADRGGIGLYVHAFADGHHAGGSQGAAAGVHDAHTAGADLIDVLQVAQGGNADARGFCGFQYGGAGRDGYRDAVDCQVDHIHGWYPPYCLEMAPNLHFSMQTPHLRHGGIDDVGSFVARDGVCGADADTEVRRARRDR